MMKKLILFSLALPLLFTACENKCVEDSGLHSTKEITVKPYNEIVVSGPVKLILRQDSSFKVNIQADSNVISLIKAEVNKNGLVIELDPKQYCGKDSIVVSAGIGELKTLEVKGASHIYTSSLINVNDLDIKSSGATTINMDLTAGKLTTTTDGEAHINLTGQAGVHQVKSKGVIQMNAFDFITGIYDLNVEGVGKLNINVLNELKAKTSGATTIYYKGNPKKIDEDKSGVAKEKKVN
ncbi:head GIN domain-containing protein [Pedobacter sp. NJ-S-72]